MPINRDEEGVSLDLPLEFIGCQNLIAPKTQVLLHDRSYPMQMRMLSPENVNISTRAKKRIERMEGGELTNITDYWWTDVDSIKAAQDCFLNYASLMQILWPLDPTALMMIRVMHQYGWIAVTKDETKRVAVIQAFFEAVIKENCQRAVNKKPPYKSEEQEGLLKRILIRYGLKEEVPFLSGSLYTGEAAANENGERRAGSAGGGSGGQQGQRQQFNNSRQQKNRERKIASYQGLGTCYDYNGRFGNKCKNSKGSSSSTCKDPNNKGKEYAHVCNRFVPDKNGFCLGKHPRSEHRGK